MSLTVDSPQVVFALAVKRYGRAIAALQRATAKGDSWCVDAPLLWPIGHMLRVEGPEADEVRAAYIDLHRLHAVALATPVPELVGAA